MSSSPCPKTTPEVLCNRRAGSMLQGILRHRVIVLTALVLDDVLEHRIGSFLEHHEPLLSAGNCSKELVELSLAGRLLTALGVLNGKDHDQRGRRHSDLASDHPPGRESEDRSHEQEAEEQSNHDERCLRPRAVMVDAIKEPARSRKLGRSPSDGAAWITMVSHFGILSCPRIDEPPGPSAIRDCGDGPSGHHNSTGLLVGVLATNHVAVAVIDQGAAMHTAGGRHRRAAVGDVDRRHYRPGPGDP